MKFRLDFVTNSSSVSYIVSLNPDIAEFRKFKSKNYDGDIRKLRIYTALYNDIFKNGEKKNLAGVNIYTKRYDFSKKPDCVYDTSFDSPVDKIDFGSMEDGELWKYIFGEYLVNGRLSGELKGFGSLQIPRDEKRFREKRCEVVQCINCDRKNTSDCLKAEDLNESQ